jgi:hypothetical protein
MKRGLTVKGSTAASTFASDMRILLMGLTLIVGAMSMSTRAGLLTQPTAHFAAYR